MTVTDSPAPGGLSFPESGDSALYARLLENVRTTKRCPIWVGDVRWFGEAAVPNDVTGAIGAVTARDVLSDWWPGPCPQGCACLEPFTGTFPELVRADSVDRSTRPATLEEAVSFGVEAGDLATLGVVDADRPADVPVALRWFGTCNYAERGDLVRVSAVLRSWEERFGATLVWIGGATLILTVADPPTSRADSERVAAEHFAFCPDQHDPQTGREPYTPASYGRLIRGERLWKFWWD